MSNSLEDFGERKSQTFSLCPMTTAAVISRSREIMANNHKTAARTSCLFGTRDVHVGNLSSALRWKDADDDELGLQLIGCKSPSLHVLIFAWMRWLLIKSPMETRGWKCTLTRWTVLCVDIGSRLSRSRYVLRSG